MDLQTVTACLRLALQLNRSELDAGARVRDGAKNVTYPESHPEVQAQFVTDYGQSCCHQKQKKLECGPMPNLMVALSNIGGALCSTPQSLADAHY